MVKWTTERNDTLENAETTVEYDKKMVGTVEYDKKMVGTVEYDKKMVRNVMDTVENDEIALEIND